MIRWSGKTDLLLDPKSESTYEGRRSIARNMLRFCELIKGKPPKVAFSVLGDYAHKIAPQTFSRSSVAAESSEIDV